jgi:hypothetical protein
VIPCTNRHAEAAIRVAFFAGGTAERRKSCIGIALLDADRVDARLVAFALKAFPRACLFAGVAPAFLAVIAIGVFLTSFVVVVIAVGVIVFVLVVVLAVAVIVVVGVVGLAVAVHVVVIAVGNSVAIDIRIESVLDLVAVNVEVIAVGDAIAVDVGAVRGVVKVAPGLEFFEVGRPVPVSIPKQRRQGGDVAFREAVGDRVAVAVGQIVLPGA